ncbi:helix-turn-helix domain-containing protein [Chitinophaga filiformis]|uniref:helix-turn-helix domain-containing protein n=1 Tax=Chitinophaga filiformis TaxID=104663 RepID=UPI001F29D007|nr:helix-turn-helix domain-containing protein [Chitinophaga filiformis]MCF6406396.1 helix-turn-helix domain-containing protein [Chitinophaga filiformis]
MSYHEYQPSGTLHDYIDAYWTLSTASTGAPYNQTIFPDACVDIIMNLGDTCLQVNDHTVLHPGNNYLVGPMSERSQVVNPPGTRLLGIRFRPGAFTSFYKSPLHEITDRIIEFRDRNILAMAYTDKHIITRIDHYFRQRSASGTTLLSIMNYLQQCKGQVSINKLAEMHHMSIRTLERLVKNSTGITLKKTAGIIRFQYALKQLKAYNAPDSLLRIALESGYYDQAHLSNEIKKYAGLPPSALLSR